MSDTTASSPSVSARSLVLRYGKRLALDDVSITLGQGVTALVGVNGAGKSTLMRVLSGGQRPTSGDIRVAGSQLYGRNRRNVLGRIALMPQQCSFPRNMTALEVTSYLTWMRGVARTEASTRARDSLASVGLSKRRDAKVRELSGGMLRRLALAQALAARSDVTILDEPSTGLDPKQRRVMVDLIKDVPGTVLLSSHVMEDVVDVAGRIVVLDAGHIRFAGAMTELIERAPQNTDPSRRAEAAFLSLIDTEDVESTDDRPVGNA